MLIKNTRKDTKVVINSICPNSVDWKTLAYTGTKKKPINFPATGKIPYMDIFLKNEFTVLYKNEISRYLSLLYHHAEIYFQDDIDNDL